MDTSTYTAYVVRVKALGGVVTNMPSGIHQGQPAARYYYTTYGPKVNAHEWPMPEVFSADGTWGYYVAGTEFQDDALVQQLQREASQFSQATDQEAKNAAGGTWWAQLKTAIGGAGIPKWALYGGAALLLFPLVSSALSFLPRRNPRGRRRAHTRSRTRRIRRTAARRRLTRGR